MRKRLAMLTAAAAIGLSVLSFDASMALAQCSKDRGTITCEDTETVGNAPDSSNAQQTTTTSTKKGSLNSSHEEESECVGPAGQCR